MKEPRSMVDVFNNILLANQSVDMTYSHVYSLQILNQKGSTRFRSVTTCVFFHGFVALRSTWCQVYLQIGPPRKLARHGGSWFSPCGGCRFVPRLSWGCGNGNCAERVVQIIEHICVIFSSYFIEFSKWWILKLFADLGCWSRMLLSLCSAKGHGRSCHESWHLWAAAWCDSDRLLPMVIFGKVL